MLKNLRIKSNDDLVTSARQLATAEKRHAVELIRYIAEISRRRLHLERGYKSLFLFCVKEFGLDEGQVYLRTQVAAKINHFPQLLKALEANALTLTTAGMLARHLTAENCDRLINACAGKSKAEVELVLVSLAPRPLKQPDIKPLVSGDEVQNGAPTTAPPPTAAPQSVDEAPAMPSAETSGFALQTQTLAEVNDSQKEAGRIQPATPEFYNLTFHARKECIEKLERLAELQGVSAKRNLAELLELALDAALDKQDPIRKEERRTQRQERRGVKSNVTAKGVATKGVATKKRRQPQRMPGIGVRREALLRAGHRCEYISAKSGRRCTQRRHLELDNVEPWAVGGGHELINLRVLCKAHNLLKALKDFPGKRFDSNGSSRHNFS